MGTQRRRSVRALAGGLLILLLSGCAAVAGLIPGDPTPSGAPPPSRSAGGTGASGETVQWTFYVVRHADRADDGTDDPPLTEAGEERAERLARLLDDRRGVAAYATDFRRSQDTARPTAEAWGVPVTSYPADTGPDELVRRVQAEHGGGTVLIVGHSNTVPGIVGRLCRCPVDPISESAFGNLYRVELSVHGTVLRSDRQADY